MMELVYQQSEGYQEERPAEVDETSSKYVVYLRRNIQEVPNTSQTPDEVVEGTHWKYEECRLTKAEYAQYKEELRDAALQAFVNLLNEGKTISKEDLIR